MKPVLVVDFGAQYAQLIARRVREASVFSEIVHHSITAQEVAAKNPAAIILSGGPSSVYEAGSPQLDAAILELGVPVLGICYGFQVLAQALGGKVDKTGKREYGATDLTLSDGGVLLAGQPDIQAPGGKALPAGPASTGELPLPRSRHLPNLELGQCDCRAG
jgi:GMP synthase (glutamine-hydrolysing)